MKPALQVKTKLTLLGGDLLLLTICFLAATYIRLDDPSLVYSEYGVATALCLLIYPLSLYLTRSYEVQPEASSPENLRRPLLGLIVAATVTSFIFYFAPEIRYARGIYAIANALFISLLVVWRLGMFFRLRRRRLSILIMGNASAVEMSCKVIQEFSPLSHIYEWRPGAGLEGEPVRIDSNRGLSSPDDIDLVILAGHSIDLPALRTAASLRLQGVSVWNLPRLFSELAERLPAQHLDERWLATAEGFPSLNEQSFHVIKRLVDIILALLGLGLGLPLLAMAAILIKLQDGDTVIYSQERVGKGGKVFRVHKLRTMVRQAEQDTGPVWASPDDPRITRVGRWLRKLRIDELPQMWNVLKGEMSLVGPRPERQMFVEAFQAKYPIYSLRHLVRPGVTGWAQVRSQYAANEEENVLKLEYDLYYVQNASLLFDVRIILKTISTVVSAWGSR